LDGSGVLLLSAMRLDAQEMLRPVVSGAIIMRVHDGSSAQASEFVLA